MCRQKIFGIIIFRIEGKFLYEVLLCWYIFKQSELFGNWLGVILIMGGSGRGDRKWEVEVWIMKFF